MGFWFDAVASCPATRRRFCCEAITIHKVQGQTLSRLIVDLQGGAFAAGQTYVAISRCRSMEGLRLRRQVQVSDVQTDPDVREFVDAVQGSLANRVLDE